MFTDADIVLILEYLTGAFILGYLVGVLITGFKKALDYI